MTEPHFVGRWVRSYEEAVQGAAVYRPESYPFPPARGRAAIEIHADGRFVDARIGPIEGSPPTLGRWTSVDGRTGTAVFPEATLSFELEDTEDGMKRLLVRRG